MEILIVIALAAVLMLCLGFGLSDVLMLFVFVLGAGIVLSGVFFAVCLVFLLSSKRVVAEYSRLDEKPRFPVALYKTDFGELPNIFPCEMVLRDKLYVPDKKIHILKCGLRKAVIDKNALLTIVFGSAVFIPAAVFAMVRLIEIF